MEIDRTEVFTWAFAQIKFIPVFTSWKHYSVDIDIGKLPSFTLYTVEVKASNVFLNKRYNLIYVKFLRNLLQANNENMFCYKTPSCIHKVNYDQLVNELWETDLTKDDKKLGNITFGMLYTSHHTAQKSYCFNTLREACRCQSEFAGRIYAIQQEKERRRNTHAIPITPQTLPIAIY